MFTIIILARIIVLFSYSTLSLSIYVANKNSFVLALKLLSQLQSLRTAQYSVYVFVFPLSILLFFFLFYFFIFFFNFLHFPSYSFFTLKNRIFYFLFTMDGSIFLLKKIDLENVVMSFKKKRHFFFFFFSFSNIDTIICNFFLLIHM